MKIAINTIIIFYLQFCQGEIFQDPYRLAGLFLLEEKVIEQLNQIPDNYKSGQLSSFKLSLASRLNEIPFNSDKAMVLDRLVGNPVHVYSLIERQVELLPALRRELVEHPDLKMIEENIALLLSEKSDLPSRLDLVGASQALARVQFAYRLNPLDLAQGLIMGVQTAASLTAAQMLSIARDRHSDENPIRPNIGREYALAIEWAEGALELASQSQEDELLMWEAKNFIYWAQREHDLAWRSPVGNRGIFPNEEFFVSKLTEEGQNLSGLDLRKEEKLFLKSEPVNDTLDLGFHVHDFYALCRGEEVPHTPSITLPSPCSLTTKGQPYFILAPLHKEIVSLELPIIIYHDIITEKEIDFLTREVLSRLDVASVIDLKQDGTEGKRVSVDRTQSHGWLWDNDNDLLFKLSKKTGRFAGLNTHRPTNVPEQEQIEAEAWQIGLYGPGGHYLPHHDSLDNMPGSYTPSGIWVGGRMATVMFYLSDIHAGSTAFPKLGLSIAPTKGSAVFWYNQLSDGRNQDRSLHGGCPVALGLKWVSNKWIREGSQVWKRPCPRHDLKEDFTTML